MVFDPEKITFFATTNTRGRSIPFGIKAKDRQRHMYVIGKTGMGKSTLLENMAAQDIRNGEGMAFIDPHGSAAETLLEYIPENRIKDTVYFAPFDLENPLAFNVMEDVGADKRHLVVSGLMSTFKKIWVDAWSARMEYILSNALLALIEYPETTLLSVNRLFVDKNFRTKVVDYIKDPAVKSFWVDEFAKYTDRFTAEALPAIQNKIGQFTGNPLIRNIIGQPKSSFNIRQIMDERKILIINLSKGLIGETNANLLGSMLTTRIYLAAMSRSDLTVEQMKKMPNFYFYVDEFQSFANSTFADILSEARKYHLNLIIAHQYIEQMEEDVKNAVFGNVGTTVSFRVGPFDAEVLETVFTPKFTAEDLVNLGFAQIYLTLMIDGIGSSPFSAQTLPPLEKPLVSYKDKVISSSRTIYARSRVVVEKDIAQRHASTTETGLSNSKKDYVSKTKNIPNTTSGGVASRVFDNNNRSYANRTDNENSTRNENSDNSLSYMSTNKTNEYKNDYNNLQTKKEDGGENKRNFGETKKYNNETLSNSQTEPDQNKESGHSFRMKRKYHNDYYDRSKIAVNKQTAFKKHTNSLFKRSSDDKISKKGSFNGNYDGDDKHKSTESDNRKELKSVLSELLSNYQKEVEENQQKHKEELSSSIEKLVKNEHNNRQFVSEHEKKEYKNQEASQKNTHDTYKTILPAGKQVDRNSGISTIQKRTIIDKKSDNIDINNHMKGGVVTDNTGKDTDTKIETNFKTKSHTYTKDSRTYPVRENFEKVKKSYDFKGEKTTIYDTVTEINNQNTNKQRVEYTNTEHQKTEYKNDLTEGLSLPIIYTPRTIIAKMLLKDRTVMFKKESDSEKKIETNTVNQANNESMEKPLVLNHNEGDIENKHTDAKISKSNSAFAKKIEYNNDTVPFLDVKKIKQLLRHNGKEKTPFK